MGWRRDWHEKHKGMKLAPATRKTVEYILDKIKMELDKEKEVVYKQRTSQERNGVAILLTI